MKYLADVVTLFYEPKKCNGCGMCTVVCPHGVFSMGDKRAVLADRDACMECGACAVNCQAGAIEVRAGVGCANGVINGMLRGTEPTCDCSGDGGQTCC